MQNARRIQYISLSSSSRVRIVLIKWGFLSYTDFITYAVFWVVSQPGFLTTIMKLCQIGQNAVFASVRVRVAVRSSQI